jgi:hypothetical protein
MLFSISERRYSKKEEKDSFLEFVTDDNET